MYIPKFKSINVDGAYFGTSVPHIFLKTFKEAVVLPPRIFNYEPKIHGFRLYKKTGSRAAGSKDVIHYPKPMCPEKAVEELKSRPCKEKQRKRLADEDVAMEGQNDENQPVEQNTTNQQNNDNNQNSKKNKKKNKRKGKGKN